MSKKQSDIIKGIAIMLMIFHHLFYTRKVYELYTLTGMIIDEDITRAVANEMKVCVNLFAMLSGYGLFIKMQMPKDNGRIVSRQLLYVARSYINLVKDTIFLMALLAAVSVWFGFSRTPESVWGEKNVQGILTNMFGVAGFFRLKWFVSPWWYLHLAILFILLSPFLSYAVRRCGIECLVVIMILPYLLRVNLTYDNIWRYLPSFMGGMILADRKTVEKLETGKRLTTRWKKSLFFTAVFIVSYMLLFHIRQWTGLKNHIIHTVQAVLIVLFSASVISKISGINAILELLGKHSKYMWLIHAFIYGQIMGAALYSLGNIWLIFSSVLLVSLVAAILLKTILHNTLSLIPGLTNSWNCKS